MRTGLTTLMVLLAAVARGADDAPQATGALDGIPVKFPEKRLAEGVKATVGLLESCHSESQFRGDELKQALQGDHVRLVFAKPIAAEVMNKKIKFSELVFRLPLNTGVFWVRAEDNWQRYSKYELQKETLFADWVKEARPTK
jgi:hypothetical protein